MRVTKAEYEENKAQWEREKFMLQGKIREARMQNNKSQEKLNCQKMLVAKYEQELNTKQIEYNGQAQSINDILKECAKEKPEKECHANLYHKLKENVDRLEMMAAQGK